MGIFGWLLAASWALPFSPLFFSVLCALAGNLTGFFSGRLIIAVCRRWDFSFTGAVIGYGLLVLPAARLGIWTSYSAASMLSEHLQGQAEVLSVTAFVLTFILFFVLFANLLVACGALLGAGLAAILRRFLPGLVNFVVRLMTGLFRSRAQMLRTAVLLLILGFVVFKYWDIVNYRLITMSPDVPKSSAWIEKQQRLFLGALSQGQHDVLVVPFNVVGSSIDRPARALITRQLAREIAYRSKLVVADPTLVMRSLGVHSRANSDAKIHALADAIKATTIIGGEIRRKPGEFWYSIVVTADRRSESGKWQKHTIWKNDKIEFSDALPPELAFREQINDLLPKLPLLLSLDPLPQIRVQQHKSLPESPRALLDMEDYSPVGRAVALQLFASFHDIDAPFGAQLWERSLMALQDVTVDSDLYNLLTARAYFNLHRRPYARHLLEQSTTVAEKAFYAYMQGNLAELGERIPDIDQPLLQLIAEIELTHLRNKYQNNKQARENARVLLTKFKPFGLLLSQRALVSEWFLPKIHGAVAKALRKEGYASLEAGVADYLRLIKNVMMASYVGKLKLRNNLHLAMKIEETYKPLWMHRAAEWLQFRAVDRLTEWDYVDLLYSINRGEVLRSTYSIIIRQDLPSEGLAQIDVLSPVYAGYPALSYPKTRAIWQLGKKRGNPASSGERCRRIARDAYLWEGGETRNASKLEYYAALGTYKKYLDEPPRAWRDYSTLNKVTHIVNRGKDDSAVATWLQRRLDYSHTEFDLLIELDKYLRSRNRDAEADIMVQTQKNRFIGAPKRNQFIATQLKKDKNPAAAMTYLRQAIKREPDNWPNYLATARLYLEEQKNSLANDILKMFPRFKDRSGNPVALANYAEYSGRLFHKIGDVEHAKYWYRLSKSFETGALAEMRAGQALRVFYGDIEAAKKITGQALNRYNDTQSAALYLSYMFILGQHKQAWEYFGKLESRKNKIQLWIAPLVGHRIAGASDVNIKKWIQQSSSFDLSRNYLSGALRENYFFVSMAIDRPVSSDNLELMKEITDSYNKSYFYVDLLKGYFALRQKQWKTAIDSLTGLSITLSETSGQRGTAENSILPYLLLAHIQDNDSKGAKGLLDWHTKVAGRDFDYEIGSALLAGFAGQHEQAEMHLLQAFLNQPPVSDRAFFPLYGLAEAVENLFESTRREKYRDWLLRIAKAQQLKWPAAWAWAMEAKYSKDKQVQMNALGVALYLDKRSFRISNFSKKEKSEAVRLFRQRNPFQLSKKVMSEHYKRK